MAVVDALNSMGQPDEREPFARLAPLVVFFKAAQHI